MEEFAIKTYVDKRVDYQVGHQLGIVMEDFDDKFRILQEGQSGLAENADRFELETGQRFKSVQNSLDSLSLDVLNLGNKLDLVRGEIRELKGEIKNERFN